MKAVIFCKIYQRTVSLHGVGDFRKHALKQLTYILGVQCIQHNVEGSRKSLICSMKVLYRTQLFSIGNYLIVYRSGNKHESLCGRPYSLGTHSQRQRFTGSVRDRYKRCAPVKREGQ